MEDDLLLNIDWALNVMDNGEGRPDAILAHLGVPIELWQHRPWGETPIKDALTAWAIAIELKGRIVAAEYVPVAEGGLGKVATQPSTKKPLLTRGAAAKRRSDGDGGGEAGEGGSGGGEPAQEAEPAQGTPPSRNQRQARRDLARLQ